MKEYDILNGGIEELQKDLLAYQNYLTYANMEFVSKLSEFGMNEIISNATRADEIDQRLDIANKNTIKQGLRGKNISSDTILNSSPNASYAEFGYGIIGKASQYSHSDFLDRYAIGWYGYDIDTKSKLPNRSWFYKDSFGYKHNTFGATPRNIFYNAGMKIVSEFPRIAQSIFDRWDKL